jgi:TolB-like protein/tetratricopeptide (TPR) repeat protein
MNSALRPIAPQLSNTAEGRLDSWKEIAVYLHRGVRTVRRWEKEEGLPVHRHHHLRLGSVYAYRSELDSWWDTRRMRLEPEPYPTDTERQEPSLGRHGRGQARPQHPVAITVAGIVFLAATGYLAWRSRPATPTAAPERVTLAVLPFENLSGDREQDYLGDGFTEDLITELGRLNSERLAVIARTSVIPYKRAPKSVGEIARELSVEYLVQGSLRSEAGRLRISVQLIRTSDKMNVWAESYEGELQAPVSMQSDVARAVASEIRLQLPEPGDAGRAGWPLIGPEAHEAYLKGRYDLDRRTPETLLSARRWFERAIALEPRYAAAFVGLADSHILAVTYLDASPEESVRQARAAIQRALELNERLPEAYAWLGIIRSEFDWDWPGAEIAFRRALQLDPNFAYAHKLYAEHLSYLGSFDEAVSEARMARRLDPLSVVTNSMLGIVLYRARWYDQALEALAEAVRLSPGHPLPYLPLGLVYAQQGRYPDAIAALERARSLTPDNSELVAQLGHVYARAGNTKEARTLLDDLDRRSREQYVSPFHFAVLYTGLGDTRRAMERLEEGFRQRVWFMCVVKTDPVFDPLRTDPGFQALLRRMGLGAGSPP